MPERWLPIPGFEGRYDVSDQGRVRSHLRGGRILKGSYDGNAYMAVGLHYGAGRQVTRSIHTLVLLAFAGEPAGRVGRHLDGDYFNNTLANLTYGTLSENSLDRVRHGRDRNARKVACSAGHDFTPVNTYITPSGARNCRECKRQANVRYRMKESA